ncbi:MAG TPA: phage tail sheath C-terminal domain-containing protein [Pyrinomonadaceae bacterium]|jgi:phage tail sheath protein FI|nr:phage tail sheath C-terminal domain-containing protein [Pyrinomonadaceae bacterium]
MKNFQTPGVYLREIDVAPAPLLRMSVTGFVGQAERGPLDYPQQLTSWGQFRDIYGDFVGYSYLSFAVFGFFLNGGERCYVVRVAHETATRAARSLQHKGEQPAFRVEAVNAGRWGNGLNVSVEEQSSRDLVLTELDAALGGKEKTVKFRSVAGLAAGDVLTLVHPRDPVREKLTVAAVDYKNQLVTFDAPPTAPNFFPSGSGVLGRGFKLIVRNQPLGRLLREEVFDNLSLDPAHERYFASVVNGEPEEADYVRRIRAGNSILVRVEDLSAGTTASNSRPARVEFQKLEGGTDDPRLLDVRYFSGYENGEYFRHSLAVKTPAQAKDELPLRGLANFELVSDIGLVAIPDLIIPDYFTLAQQVAAGSDEVIYSRIPVASLNAETLPNFNTGQRELLAHCARMGDRFALLDSPRGAETSRGKNRIEEWPEQFHLSPLAKWGALYYPWIREKAADFDGRDLFIPPSGHVAGIYARTETASGIGRAPANEVLQGVVEFEFCLTDAEQAMLNPRGVNCLRSFPGRGLLVWGARTLSADPNWRYVNVRRVCLAIIKQILVNLQWTVFEPNTRALWDKIVATLSLFLRDLFRRGALAGTKPSEAFFVKCDAETNPPEVVERGQVITLIGFAPARPAEFILVTIKRTAESVTVREQG